jgi:hypothetical protein
MPILLSFDFGFAFPNSGFLELDFPHKKKETQILFKLFETIKEYMNSYARCILIKGL